MTRRRPGSKSLALAPTQRQSAELILKVRMALMDSGERLAVDNAFSVAVDNGLRCLALPGASAPRARSIQACSQGRRGEECEVCGHRCQCQNRCH